MLRHDTPLPKPSRPGFEILILAAGLSLAACSPVPGAEESGEPGDPITATGETVDIAAQASTEPMTEPTESDVIERSEDASAELAPPDPPAPMLVERFELVSEAGPDAEQLGLLTAEESGQGADVASVGWQVLDETAGRAVAWSYGRAVEQPHVLALYEREDEGWSKLDQLGLDERLLPAEEWATEAGQPAEVFPVFLFEDGLEAVAAGPEVTWLSLRGGWGANSGAFLLVDASGDVLRPLYARLETFPGSTSLEDLDEDGRPEILLDETDGYVFCRACGVAEANFRFLGWNEVAGEFMPLAGPELSTALPASERGPLADALSLAEAGLWKDALASLEAVETSSAAALDDPNLAWQARWIRRTAEARADLAEREVSPGGQLLHAVFYGDYAAAQEQLAAHAPAALLGDAPPLLESGWEDEMRTRIEHATSDALIIAGESPQWSGRAAAQLLRGWARWTTQPGDEAALENLRQAAELAPEDDFIQTMLEEAERRSAP